MKEKISLFLMAIILFSCSTTKPIYEKKEVLNNEVDAYIKPQYETKHTPFYNTSKHIISLGAGAATGYYIYNDLTNKNKSEPFGTGFALGAATTVISYYIFAWFGPDENKTQINSVQVNQWITDFDKEIFNGNKFFLDETKDNNNTITKFLFVIPEKNESTFRIKELSDAEIFSIAFPKSLYTEEVITKSLDNFSIQDLPSLDNIFNKKIDTKFIKIKSLNKYKSFGDLIKIYKYFPEIKIEAEKKIANSATDLYEYEEYLKLFPDGASYSEILNKKNKITEELQRINNEKIEQENKIKFENEQQKQKELEIKRKSITKNDKDKYIIRLGQIKAKIDYKNEEKIKLEKEREQYNYSSNKFSYQENQKRKEKYQEILRQQMGIDIDIIQLKGELNEIYDLLPDLK